MPVDKQQLENAIQEAFGGDQELIDFARKKYEANDALAAKFLGGFMRNYDYTQKTQLLQNDRKALETKASQYQTALENSEKEKDSIMGKLAQQNMTVAQARAAMENLKVKYALTDEDLPTIGDMIQTRKTGDVNDSTPDLEERFKSFKNDLMSEFDKRLGSTNTDLGGLAVLPLIWQDVNDQHQELTGKRLTFKDQQDILNDARASNKPIRQIWEEKYGISGDDGLRMKKREEQWTANARSSYDKEQAQKRSDEAMGVIRPAADTSFMDNPQISRVYKTQFKTYSPDPLEQVTVGVQQPAKIDVPAGAHERRMPAAGDKTRLRGAEKAAQKFIAKGGPASMGKTADQVSRGGKAA